jgi:hypothetical protein
MYAFQVNRYVAAPLLCPLKTFPLKNMLDRQDAFQWRRQEGQLANILVWKI